MACHEGERFSKQIQIRLRLAAGAGLAYQNESRCACSIGADNSQLDTINADFGLSEIRTLGLLPIDWYGQRAGHVDSAPETGHHARWHSPKAVDKSLDDCC